MAKPFRLTTLMLVGLGILLTGCAESLQANQGAATNAKVEMIPHRASYVVTLDSVGGGRSITSATGVMLFSLQTHCTGWSSEFRMDVGLSNDRNPVQKISQSFINWENFNGKEYQFRISDENPGENTVRGKTKFDGGSLTAHFVLPDERRIVLPEEVMLPNQHTLRLLRAAKSGSQMLNAPVFDGSSVDGAMRVSAAIGKDALYDGNIESLQGLTAWPISLAFFGKENDMVPSSQQRFEFLENGVISHIVFDYNWFALRGTLTKLELLKLPENCHKEQ